MAVIFGDFSVSTVTTSEENNQIIGTPPPNIQVGDWMFAYLGNTGSLFADPDGELVVPAGWVQKAANYDRDGRYMLHGGVFVKQYTGTESFTFGVITDLRDDILIIQRMLGDIDPADPITIVSAYPAEGTQVTDVVTAGITTVEPNTTVVSFAGMRNGASSAAIDTGGPAGMTTRWNRQTRVFSSACRIALASEVIATPGATGDRTWVDLSDDPQYGAGIMFAINEVSGAPTPGLRINVEDANAPSTPVNDTGYTVVVRSAVDSAVILYQTDTAEIVNGVIEITDALVGSVDDTVFVTIFKEIVDVEYPDGELSKRSSGYAVVVNMATGDVS